MLEKTFRKTLIYGHWLCRKPSAGLIWDAAYGVQYVAAAVMRKAQAAATARWRNTTPLVPAPLLLYGRAGHLSLSLLCFSFTHTSLQAISFWISANLLTLNTSKTEFLLIEVKQQLDKITPAHLTQYTLLIILASFLMNILLLSDQISALSKSCYSHIRQLRCLRPYLDLKQSFLPPSFTSILTTTTHFTMSMSMTWLNMGISAKPSSTHPKFFSSCRRQSPSILPYNPFSPIFTLAQN